MTTSSILVVTGDDARRRTLTDAFAKAGFAIAHAATGRDALAMPSAPAIVVVDVDLPDLHGFELCRRLRAQPATAQRLVAVVCRASAPAAMQAAAFEGGADAVFREPIDARLVAANLGALLRLRTAERAAGRRQLDDDGKGAEKRLGVLADAVDDVFWVYQLEPLTCVYISPSYERRWGLSRQAVYADATVWERMVHPEDADRVAQAFVAKAATGGFDEEYRVVLRGGRIRWVRDRAFPIVDDDGRVRCVAGITEDVTERRAMRTTLEATQVWLELARQGARAGAWELIVPTGEVRWSAACHDIYGVPRDTPLSYATWTSRVHPQDRDRATRAVAGAMAAGEDLSLEFAPSGPTATSAGSARSPGSYGMRADARRAWWGSASTSPSPSVSPSCATSSSSSRNDCPGWWTWTGSSERPRRPSVSVSACRAASSPRSSRTPPPPSSVRTSTGACARSPGPGRRWRAARRWCRD